MKFDGNRVAFGRHETFALRYSWLSKGFSALKQDPLVFDNDDAVVELGVGRNMVNSIRYWLRASQMITPQKPDEPLELGELLFDEKSGLDPYLEDEATIWLIHWLIATNSELATSWFWFFNKFHKPEFSGQELQTALHDFVKDQVVENKRPSMGTLKNDAQLLPRMYTQSRGNTRIPLEDALDSPLSLLGLVTQSSTGKLFQSKPQARPNLPIGIFGFAVAQLMASLGHMAVPLEDLMYSQHDQAAPGSVFRLTESDMIAKLEKMESYLPGKFEIRETAGIHQLYRVDDVEPVEYLKKHYREMTTEIAA
jgi:hypothetical protein